MKTTSMFAGALAACMTLTSIAPLAAAPIAQVKPSGSMSVELVQFNPDARRDERRRIIRRGNNAYFNGYRGYRSSRRGYREHNGFWFPAAAFLAGALITGAVRNSAPPPVRYRSSNAHVEWCYDRYRSYRASDNSFQPYDGGRRQCYSPYS